MIETSPGMDAETMKIGLLMESAQAHQRIAETHLEALRVHTQGLDAVVRDEIRRTMVDELKGVTLEADRAAGALRGVERRAMGRSVVWNLALLLVCTGLPLTLGRWAMPSAGELMALRHERDAMMLSLSQLRAQGGKVDWRRCGDPARLCIRIDRTAPVYGSEADYYVVKGY